MHPSLTKKNLRHNGLENLSTSLSYTSSIKFNQTQPPQSSQIDKVRARNKGVRTKINGEIAKAVVRNYILPAIEMYNQSIFTRKRFLDFGLSPKSSQVQGSKLTDEIKEELESTKTKLTEMKQRLQEVSQEKQEAISQTKDLTEDLMNKLLSCKILKLQLKKVKNPQEVPELNRDAATRLEKLKVLYGKAYEQKKLISKKLDKERTVNYSLENNSVELGFWNCLHLMENQITGENLKGLYRSSNNLFKNAIETQLKAEFYNALEGNQKLNEFLQVYFPLIKQIFLEKALLIQSNYETLTNRSDMINEVKKLRFTFRDKIDQYQKNIKKTVQERDLIDQKLSKNEKKQQQFNTELNEIKKKVNQLKGKNRIDEANELKSCTYCDTWFIEKENMNWSCRRHTNKWNGSIYFCCGQTKEKALGCQYSKHISKEEEEEEIQKTKKSWCSSCRQHGHSLEDCPKDPNVKGNSDSIREELSRVGTIKTIKERIKDRPNYSKFKEYLSSQGNTDRTENSDWEDLKEVKAQV